MDIRGFSMFNLVADCESCGLPIDFNLTLIYNSTTGRYRHISCEQTKANVAVFKTTTE